MNDTATITVTHVEQDQAAGNRLVNLAVCGLVPMFDDRHQLFCYKLKKSDQGTVTEGLSHRYTMMTIMGLHRLEGTGVAPVFDTAHILRNLFRDLKWVDNLGDLGVLLWLCGTVCPERLPEVERELNLASALQRYRGARECVTMDLAWFLTGLSYYGLAYREKLQPLQPLAFETYRLMIRNQGKGFFGHQSSSRTLVGIARGRVGSFADQVYPIYAMTQFGKAYQHDEALIRALKCARAICDVQGPLGQWWWHYDSLGGKVTEGYPVFSVHQHAMAPMTLFALGETINYDFAPWIYKGLRWINSNNKLGFEMEDSSRNIVWRCIYRPHRSSMQYLRGRFGRYVNPVEQEQQGEFKVLFECRPYELGWLLYAFAGR